MHRSAYPIVVDKVRLRGCSPACCTHWHPWYRKSTTVCIGDEDVRTRTGDRWHWGSCLRTRWRRWRFCSGWQGRTPPGVPTMKHSKGWRSRGRPRLEHPVGHRWHWWTGRFSSPGGRPEGSTGQSWSCRSWGACWRWRWACSSCRSRCWGRTGSERSWCRWRGRSGWWLDWCPVRWWTWWGRNGPSSKWNSWCIRRWRRPDRSPGNTNEPWCNIGYGYKWTRCNIGYGYKWTRCNIGYGYKWTRCNIGYGYKWTRCNIGYGYKWTRCNIGYGYIWTRCNIGYGYKWTRCNIGHGYKWTRCKYRVWLQMNKV